MTNEIYLFSIPVYTANKLSGKSKIIPGKVTYEDNIALELIPPPLKNPISGIVSRQWCSVSRLVFIAIEWVLCKSEILYPHLYGTVWNNVN